MGGELLNCISVDCGMLYKPHLMNQWHCSVIQDVLQIIPIPSFHDYQKVVRFFGDLEEKKKEIKEIRHQL